ncbi:MAG: hypothetical protein JSS13_01470 [Proteobacteria bacterium]|nr:hypothetical protein [Pseudomonadota bacterium]
MCWNDNIPDPATLAGQQESDNGGLFGSVGGGAPTVAQLTHLTKCAVAYGSYNGRKGPNPSYTTEFSNRYGWYANNAQGTEVDWHATINATQPMGVPGCQGKIWLQNDGTTFPLTSSCNGTTWTGNTTIIWASAYTSDARMVNVLAHEWAHEWGADETNAKQVGNAAEIAFQQDHGDKCW